MIKLFRLDPVTWECVFGALRILSLGSREQPAVESPEFMGGVSESECTRTTQTACGGRGLNRQEWKSKPLVGPKA